MPHTPPPRSPTLCNPFKPGLFLRLGRGLVACVLPLGGHAMTLDFDQLCAAETRVMAQIVQGDFTIGNDDPDQEGLGIWAQADPRQLDAHGSAVFVRRADSRSSLQHVAARPFDLDAMDLTLAGTRTGTVEFVFSRADGSTVVEHLSLEPGSHWTRFALNQRQIVRAQWRWWSDSVAADSPQKARTGDGEGALQFDNLAVFLPTEGQQTLASLDNP